MTQSGTVVTQPILRWSTPVSSIFHCSALGIHQNYTTRHCYHPYFLLVNDYTSTTTGPGCGLDHVETNPELCFKVALG